MKTLVFGALLVILLVMPAFAVDYVLTDLGRGEAYGINDSGQIVGWRPDPNTGADTFFVWSKESGFTDVGPAGQAINDSGQTVGGGYLWSQEAGLTPLSLPTGVGFFSSGGINNSGQIAGSVKSDGTYEYEAIVWNNPTDFTNLGVLGWSYDINESGRVVGEYKPSPGEDHAFFWDTASGFVDIGDFGTNFARADGINDLGQIVGQYNPGGCRHAFLWSATNGLLDLGTLLGWQSNSQAVKINNNGLIVGWSMAIPSNPTPHAFVWSRNDGMVDLGLLGGGNSGASDINSKNQIVGGFIDSQGLGHIALWEPVPEPSGFIALCGGVVGLLAFRRRR